MNNPVDVAPWLGELLTELTTADPADMTIPKPTVSDKVRARRRARNKAARRSRRINRIRR